MDTGALYPYLDFQEEYLHCYCLKREETNFSHGTVSWQDLSTQRLSAVDLRQAFLRLGCMIHLLLETPSLGGHKYLLQAASLGRGSTHTAAFTLVMRRNRQSLLSCVCVTGKSPAHWFQTPAPTPNTKPGLVLNLELKEEGES